VDERRKGKVRGGIKRGGEHIKRGKEDIVKKGEGDPGKEQK
jgi:hypothetical protein